jgi:hypothetical protein
MRKVICAFFGFIEMTFLKLEELFLKKFLNELLFFFLFLIIPFVEYFIYLRFVKSKGMILAD